jgi:hypothetical protein
VEGVGSVWLNNLICWSSGGGLGYAIGCTRCVVHLQVVAARSVY